MVEEILTFSHWHYMLVILLTSRRVSHYRARCSTIAFVTCFILKDADAASGKVFRTNVVCSCRWQLGRSEWNKKVNALTRGITVLATSKRKWLQLKDLCSDLVEAKERERRGGERERVSESKSQASSSSCSSHSYAWYNGTFAGSTWPALWLNATIRLAACSTCV